MYLFYPSLHMPRLRQVIKTKYTRTESDSDAGIEDLQDSTPIDIDEQNKVIEDFERSIPLNPRREPTDKDRHILIFLRALQLTFIFINLLLITLPHYRKENPFFSFFSCLSILLSAIMIDVEFLHCNTRREILNSVPNKWLMILNILLSVAITVPKLFHFTLPLDVIYFLPTLFSIAVYSTYSDWSSLDSQVQKLRSMRYHYKDA
ncbi:DEKNAAC104671 [Brettanomyces naardenensis]|uniref:DEKNAAC104671 n=1 Tax=Brettanomyces naardenensis TaxID=13370 RepID=A0A448YR99_BRENA|nr:DEKNAAC104671 [Brettanomyces naardenensis]